MEKTTAVLNDEQEKELNAILETPCIELTMEQAKGQLQDEDDEDDEKTCYNCDGILQDDEQDNEDEDGNLYCKSCYQEKFTPCIECGELINNDDGCFITLDNGCIVCQDCHDEHYEQCDGCGNTFRRDDNEVTYCNVCEQSLCDDCYSEHHTTCNDCGRSICQRYEHHRWYHGDYAICERCSDSYYSCCGCDELVYQDDVVWDDDEPYCSSCHNEHGHIHSYGYKPSPIYQYCEDEKRKIDVDLIGVELEAENKNREKWTGQIAEDLLITTNNEDEYLYYIKEDGSLDNGLEIVSHPCSLKFHQTTFPWKQVTEYLLENNCKSHNTNTCGLHVHIGRRYLTEHEQVKLGIFVNLQIERMEVIGRRSNNSYAKFKDVKGKLKTANCNNEGRYEALNWYNLRTIEFRFPKGTLLYTTILATIELVASIARFVRCHSTPQIAGNIDKSWTLYCQFLDKEKKTYKTLINYLEQKRLFKRDGE